MQTVEELIMLAINNPKGALVQFDSYNDAISMQAQLRKQLAKIVKQYDEIGKFDHPYDSIRIKFVHPKYLYIKSGAEFKVVDEATMRQLGFQVLDD